MVSFLAMCPEDLSCYVYSEFLTVKCLMVLDSGFCCTTERQQFLCLIGSLKCKVKARVGEQKSEIEWVIRKRILIEYLVLIDEEIDVSLIANKCINLIHLETRDVFDTRFCDIIHRNPNLQIIDLAQTHYLNAEFTRCLFKSTCHQNLRALRLCVDNTVTLQVITSIIKMCPNLGACEIRQCGHPLKIFAFGQDWVGNFAC